MHALRGTSSFVFICKFYAFKIHCTPNSLLLLFQLPTTTTTRESINIVFLAHLIFFSIPLPHIGYNIFLCRIFFNIPYTIYQRVSTFKISIFLFYCKRQRVLYTILFFLLFLRCCRKFPV